jgi:hypothetical protein
LRAYALAVQLERDTQHADLYAELRAQLEAVAEIEIGPLERPWHDPDSD